MARPWVELGAQDKAFVEWRPWAMTLQSAQCWLAGTAGATVVQVELGSAPLDECSWLEYRRLVQDLGHSAQWVRVVLGPEAPWGLEEAKHAVHVPLEEHAAMEGLRRLLSEVALATFIARGEGDGGAELIMPVETTATRLLMRACMEFFGAAEEVEFLADAECCLQANHPYALNRTDVQWERVDWEQSVNQNCFQVLREGVEREIGVLIRITGVRFPGLNSRLHLRVLGVRCLLLELLSNFRQPEYQQRLEAAQDQVQVRAMIKGVHVEVIPKYGFPLTKACDTGKTIKMQILMQTYIDIGVRHDPLMMELAQETLPASGVWKMATLPVKLRGKSSAMQAPLNKIVRFKHHDPNHPLIYGCWLGNFRAPAVFLEAPSQDLLTFLREDPEGPFANGVDEWPEGDALTRWSRWGFEKDAKEVMLKSDWHTLPCRAQNVELFVPRLGKEGRIQCAPPRYVAFAGAFRAANQVCFEAIMEHLRDLAVLRLDCERSAGELATLVAGLSECIRMQGHLGVIEAQVWWGDEALTLPSHTDGATSLLHLGLTLGGTRTLRVGTYPEPEEDLAGKKLRDPSVWDTTAWLRDGQLSSGLKEVKMVPGSAYLSSPYCYEHGVRYERGSREEPVIALQCRFAFTRQLGQAVNAMRDDLMLAVSRTVALQLCRFCESGGLRMPSLEEVKEALLQAPRG